MTGVLFLAATGFFWILTIGGLGGEGGGMACAFLPLALAMTYASVRLLSTASLGLGLGTHERSYPVSRSLPSEFQITKVGSSYVEFQHPEGGSWSYGITQDLSCIHGVEMIESLGNWHYRMHVRRNPVNAARVLEAAYRFRTEPKVVEDGVVVLYKCPGYEVLFQESERNLD